MNKITKRIITGLTIFFFGLTFLIIVLGAVGIARNRPVIIFGYTYSVVPTPSMEPEIMSGDIVFAKVVPYEELTVGDDVIYFSNTNQIFIVHRVIEVTPEGLVMKGINNSARDNEFVTESNYIAKVIGHTSLLALGKTIISNRNVFFAIIIFIFLMILITEIVNIIRINNEKKKIVENETNKLKEYEQLRLQVRDELEKELAEKNN